MSETPSTSAACTCDAPKQARSVTGVCLRCGLSRTTPNLRPVSAVACPWCDGRGYLHVPGRGVVGCGRCTVTGIVRTEKAQEYFDGH